jgi:SpoVK/Ycf46/Vps4 family AAA+-type ATPase
VFTKGPFERLDASKPEPAATPSPFGNLTRRQKEIVEHCLALSRIHRSLVLKGDTKTPIKPRLFPLLAAPTGAGKSALVRAVSEAIGANYYRIQRGDFYPQGSNRGVPTIIAILNHALKSKGTVLIHFDELDKWSFGDQSSPTQEWSASCFSDLFTILDGAWTFETYLASEHRMKAGDGEFTPEQLQLVSRKIFIVGSGTWQKLFDAKRRQKAPFGFNVGSPEIDRNLSGEEIFNSGVIAPELLARFNSDVQLMPYPERAEIEELLVATGISALAKKLGYQIIEYDIDFNRGGFRVLESLYTKMLVLEERVTAQRETRSVTTGGNSATKDVTIY